MRSWEVVTGNNAVNQKHNNKDADINFRHIRSRNPTSEFLHKVKVLRVKSSLDLIINTMGSQLKWHYPSCFNKLSALLSIWGKFGVQDEKYRRVTGLFEAEWSGDSPLRTGTAAHNNTEAEKMRDVHPIFT